MIRKRIFVRLTLVLFACLLGVSLIPSQAQAVPPAWVFEPESGRMVRFDATGLLEEFVLPIPDGHRLQNNTVAVAPNGVKIAYEVVSNDNSLNSLIAIYDHNQGVIVATYPINDVFTSSFSLPGARSTAFSDDSQRLVIGAVFNSGTWEMVVIDLTQFSLLAVLRSDSPVASDLPKAQTLMPFPTAFRDDEQIAFNLILMASDGMPEFPTYLWDYQSNTLQPTGGYVTPFMDIFPPTGEVVMSVVDDRLPQASSVEGFPTLNSLHVYLPGTTERFAFFADPVENLGNPRFVYNGAYILINANRVVDRGGVEVAMIEDDLEMLSALGTVNGFVYLRQLAGQYALGYGILADNGAVVGLSDAITLSSSQRPQLVWVDQNSLAQSVVKQWARLTETTLDSDLGSDGVTGSDDVLRIGGTATVATTDGDSLNVRANPGVEYAIVTRLQRGTQVTILDGPVDADGYIWWQIRTPDGRSGWAVDFADDAVTLVPGTSPNIGGEIDENVNVGADPNMPSLLSVGDVAQVTLARRSDALRMRNGAGTSYRIITLLPPGTQVDVVGGPEQADNFTWWEIRTPEGNVGWSAEIIGTERVLTRIANADGDGGNNGGGNSNIPTPVLISPLPGTIITAPSRVVQFMWQAVGGAPDYRVQIQRCDPNCVDSNSVTVAPTSAVLSMSMDGTYRWRVITLLNGEESQPSEWWSFTISASGANLLPPVLVSPADGQSFNIFPRTTPLQWQAVTGAVSYVVDVQYCDDNTLSNCIAYNPIEVVNTSYTFDFIGAQPGRWRVTAKDATGLLGAPSEWRVFYHEQ